MAVRLRPDGTFEFDSVREAVAFRREMECTNATTNDNDGDDLSSQIRSMLLEINPMLHSAIVKLCNGPLSSQEVGELLGNPIGHQIRSLKHAGRKHGLPDDWIETEVARTPEGSQASTFRLKASLIEYFRIATLL